MRGTQGEGSEAGELCVGYLLFAIPLHAARRVMADAYQRWWAFLDDLFPWSQTDRTGHSRAPEHLVRKEEEENNGKNRTEKDPPDK